MLFGAWRPYPVKNYEYRMKWNSLRGKLSGLSFNASCSHWDGQKSTTERWTFQAGGIFHKEDYQACYPDDSAPGTQYNILTAELKNGDSISFQVLPNTQDFYVTYGQYDFRIENPALYELLLSGPPSEQAERED